MAFVYLLRCDDGSLYVGSAGNLEARLAQHQLGEGGPYTRKRLPVRLVFAQEFQRVDEAFEREHQIKGWNRAKKEALISGKIGELPALSVRRQPNL